MAENEIPMGSNRAIIPEYFYRVIVIGFIHEPSNANFIPLLQQQDFKNADMLEAKRQALGYFTDIVSSLISDGKHIVPSQARIDWSQCNPDGHKVCLSLIKCELEGCEEEFCLIGASEDEMADARMEEEIAIALHRKSDRF